MLHSSLLIRSAESSYIVHGTKKIDTRDGGVMSRVIRHLQNPSRAFGEFSGRAPNFDQKNHLYSIRACCGDASEDRSRTYHGTDWKLRTRSSSLFPAYVSILSMDGALSRLEAVTSRLEALEVELYYLINSTATLCGFSSELGIVSEAIDRA